MGRMQLTPHLVRAADLVKTFETFEPDAVPTPLGGWTIGYGHTRTARKGAKVDRADGAALLIYDLMRSATVVEREVRVALTDNQRAALTAFAFNVGEQAFTRGGVAARLNAGDLDGAMREMQRWRADLSSAGQAAGPLAQRRAAERLRFLTPPQGFEPSSTPLTPPQRDGELEPRGDADDLPADVDEAPPPPVVDIASVAFEPLGTADESGPFTSPQGDAAIVPATPVHETETRVERGPVAGVRFRLPSARSRIVSIRLGALGLVLFGLAVAMILSGRLGGMDLATGLAGVLLMIPATYTLLGRRRRV